MKIKDNKHIKLAIILIGVLLLTSLVYSLSSVANNTNAINCKSINEVTEIAGMPIQLFSTQYVKSQQLLPAYCRIKGIIDKDVEFELRAPAINWNGKFVVAGCGGFCGEVKADKTGFSNSINESLKLGYAAISTDSGHKSKSWQTQWAITHPHKLDLFAGQWMPLAVNAGKGLLNKLYGAQPKRTYFSGCSNGGRLGYYAAQHYPTLFDGIAAGGAIIDLSGQAGVHGLWLLQTIRDKQNQPIIDHKKIPLLAKTVLNQCDALDGIKDDLVSAPQSCQPDLTVLTCSSHNTEQQSCFAISEIEAIEKLYQGAQIDGKQVFPGVPPGSEMFWPIWITGNHDDPGWGELAVMGYLKLVYGIKDNESLDFHKLDLKAELSKIHSLAVKLNATDTDLRDFHQAGGKFFYYHGMADPLIFYQRLEHYALQLHSTMGIEKVNDFARFFSIPGKGHCWERSNIAPDQFNPVVEINKWVESGVAPQSLTVQQFNNNNHVVRERKVCSFPQVPKLVGADEDNAASYQCQLENTTNKSKYKQQVME